MNVRKHAVRARRDPRRGPGRRGRAAGPRRRVGVRPQTVGAARDISGLPAMRERAEMIGGHIRIETAPGRGTTVEAWLPDAPHALTSRALGRDG